ncbi:MAG: DUF4238 domain-containing protein [Rhodothermaceae bacterium]|nr:DUF4238 domain-containing protein [Rhodothermaceae bacterium]MYI18162.1 DUF4238 domain-containing protein [Rhodothermaceae bacterium]
MKQFYGYESDLRRSQWTLTASYRITQKLRIKLSKMGKSKGHHFIPVFLLREFTNEHGKVWVFRKGTQDVLDVNPRNIAKETHYNSTYEDGRRNNSLEIELDRAIENRYARVVKDTIKRVRDKSPLDLRSKKNVFRDLAYIQFCRSKSIKDGFGDQRKDTGITKNALQNDYVDMMWNILNDLDKGILPIAWHDLDPLNLGVMCIKNPNKTFVIGDIPLVKVSKTEMYFSIAHDIMIYWGRENDEPERKVIPSGNGNIRRLNEMILRDSTLIAGKSRSVISDLKNCKLAGSEPRLTD